MNLKPKAAAGYLAGWVLIIAFVVLLSLIFSFLGTLICAAVAGMMMGATRLPRLPSTAVSLIFPGVIIGVLRLSHAELEDRQIVFLGVLCFSLYWAIYAVLFKLVSQEQAFKAQQKAKPEFDPRREIEAPPAGQLNGQPHPSVMRPSETQTYGVTLAALQGTWVARSQAAEGLRMLVIDHEKLLVTENDDGGTAQPLAAATLEVLNNGSVVALHPSESAALFDLEAQVSI